jgi:cobalamin biosynthesis protein CobD/CbiB
MSESDQVKKFLSNLEHIETDLVRHRTESRKRSRGAGLWLRLVFFLVVLLSLANIYFTNRLTQEFTVVIDSMVEMYEHFGRVSARMNDMRDYVADMEGNIKMMPVISAQMYEMNQDISAMTGDVENMKRSIIDMDHHVGAMTVNIQDMSLRFINLNRNVGQMGVDVNQMARPVP